MKSIRHKILFVLIGACLIPAIVLLVVTNRITGEALEKSEFAKIQGVGSEVARQVAASMKATDSSLEILKSNRTLRNPLATNVERIAEMKDMVDAFERFTDITIYAPDGFMAETTTSGSHPEPMESTSWFLKARDTGKIVTSIPHRVNGVDGLHIKVYIPVEVENFDKPHVLKARVSFDSVRSRIEGVKLGESGMIVLLDSAGKILYSPDKSDILTFFDGEFDTRRWGSHPKGEYVDQDGVEYSYWACVISDEQTHVGDSWYLISLLPKEEVVAAVRTSRLLQLAIGFGIVLVAMVFGIALGHKFSTPVIRAADAAEQVAGGNLNARLPEDTGSLEIQRLSKSFNWMIDEVREHRDELSSLVDRRTMKLQESEKRLTKMSAMLLATYEAIEEAVMVVDPDGIVVAANRHMGEFFGLDSQSLPGQSIDMIERALISCFETPRAFRAVWNEISGNPQAQDNSEWEVFEPEARTITLYSAPVFDQEGDQEGESCARLWMFRDVTEQRILQEGLQQAQKMEAVGQLAGGVAHDFNNLLTGIIGNLSLAQIGGGEDEGESPDELVRDAKRAGERAAELVKQLLGFSRRTHLKFKVSDCNEVVRDVESLTKRTLDPMVRIVTEVEPEIWGAKIDPGQIEQVVMNMAVNAKHAMKAGGTITISTQNVSLEEKHLSQNLSAEPGEYVAISVADDGCGMPPEIVAKIYEPFFTTKEQGKGTGLGLATSYGIVHQHGGWIDCASEVGKGTVFTIYLPKAAEHTPKVKVEPSDSEQMKSQVGSETILLVDDEDVVRNVAKSVLKHQGYSTLTAGDGIEALEKFESKEQEIDLVLLDLTMPRLTGAETFKRIRAEHGNVPVIVCSGYAVNLDEFEAENGARPNAFVQKPYNIADLAMQVRETLNEACLTA